MLKLALNKSMHACDDEQGINKYISVDDFYSSNLLLLHYK